MAYVLVQHLAPTHESLLPELLQKVTTIPVLEIEDEVTVEPDHIYILPSNKMLVANDGVLQLSPRSTDKNERHLPIDLFLPRWPRFIRATLSVWSCPARPVTAPRV